MQENRVRCPWCGTDPLYVAYHDTEWGAPVHADRVLFEFLTLEGAQAGLSWITVLRKREQYRHNFYDWDIEKISQMTDETLENILLDPGIIRNRLKIYSVRKNAIAALQIQQEYGSLDAYFWDIRWFHSSLEKGRLGGVSQKEILQNLSPSNSLLRSNSSSKSGELETFSEGELQTFPIINHPQTMSDLVAESDISKIISKDLKTRGMSFVGSTIMYAFMQATGMVDDHIDSCWKKNQKSFA